MACGLRRPTGAGVVARRVPAAALLLAAAAAAGLALALPLLAAFQSLLGLAAQHAPTPYKMLYAAEPTG